MSRLRAAGIHLCICFAIGFVLLSLFWFVWYPAPLFLALGGLDIFIALLTVDVVLGPVLTLIVFKSGKKSLKWDLAAIATVQVVALSYGVWTLLAGRPVFIASLGIRFDVIQANEVQIADIEASKTSLPKWGPKWVGIKQATDPVERERILYSALGGVDYGHMPQFHAPLESMKGDMLKFAKPIAELRIKNTTQDAEISAWLAERGYSDQMAVFQGLKARARDMAVILDARTAAVVGIAPFKPWD